MSMNQKLKMKLQLKGIFEALGLSLYNLLKNIEKAISIKILL